MDQETGNPPPQTGAWGVRLNWMASWCKGQRGLTVAGLALLAFFACWWAASAWQDQLVGADGTWVNSNSILGGDFLANYRAARAWLAGINPYLEPFGDPAPYLYAPILFRLFAWCYFFDARSAVLLWMVALVAMSSFGAVASWRARCALALSAVPLPFVLGAVLCSFPITFALERGNCD